MSYGDVLAIDAPCPRCEGRGVEARFDDSGPLEYEIYCAAKNQILTPAEVEEARRLYDIEIEHREFLRRVGTIGR